MSVRKVCLAAWRFSLSCLLIQREAVVAAQAT